MRTATKRAPATSQAKPAEIIVRHCRGLAEFTNCVEIQRIIWGAADVDLVPTQIFVVAAETGGQVLGAFDGDRLIGFTLAIVGLRGRKPYLHSHMTAVLDGYRRLGVGRRLKLFQREDALSRGIELIEWTFDPLELRNAYFNFRLGGVVRRFIPNFYGITTSPLHGGLPTDRLVAEWWLRSARVRRSVASADPLPPPRKKKFAHVHIPAEVARLKGTQLDEAARLQTDIRMEFEHWLRLGYAATWIKIEDDGEGEYLLEPWPRS
jgi:predicted GNAT superfamily acetyltransferase